MKQFNFECVVRPQPARSSKCLVATDLAIFAGSTLVATKVVGGRWTPEQGLREFTRRAHSFVKATTVVA